MTSKQIILIDLNVANQIRMDQTTGQHHCEWCKFVFASELMSAISSTMNIDG
jgi:hypothetical protein